MCSYMYKKHLTKAFNPEISRPSDMYRCVLHRKVSCNQTCWILCFPKCTSRQYRVTKGYLNGKYNASLVSLFQSKSHLGMSKLLFFRCTLLLEMLIVNQTLTGPSLFTCMITELLSQLDPCHDSGVSVRHFVSGIYLVLQRDICKKHGPP